jgi:hypothetical protein
MPGTFLSALRGCAHHPNRWQEALQVVSMMERWIQRELNSQSPAPPPGLLLRSSTVRTSLQVDAALARRLPASA